MKIFRLALISIALLVLCACSVGPGYEVHTLPNGKELKVLGLTKTHMATPNGIVSFLKLDYQTDLPLADKAAIEKEVSEIWTYFKNDAEQAGLTEAVIRVNSAPTGTIIKESQSIGFSYKKEPDGSWSRSGG